MSRIDDNGAPPPAAVPCAGCGSLLAPGQRECPACNRDAPPASPAWDEIQRLLRRARGQLLAGVLFLPPVMALLALRNVSRAQQLFRSAGSADAALAAAIRRASTTANVLSVLYVLLSVVLILGRWAW